MKGTLKNHSIYIFFIICFSSHFNGHFRLVALFTKCEKTITHAFENASIKALNKINLVNMMWCFKGRHIQYLLPSQPLSTFHSSVRCITAALKRTPIKDVERELKSVRSPKYNTEYSTDSHRIEICRI